MKLDFKTISELLKKILKTFYSKYEYVYSKYETKGKVLKFLRQTMINFKETMLDLNYCKI